MSDTLWAYVALFCIAFLAGRLVGYVLSRWP